MTPFKHLDAVAVPILTVNFDTDQLVPARFLSRPRENDLGSCLMRDLRFNPDGTEKPDFILNQPEFKPAKIVVGAQNFACGSSRENAVWVLYEYGMRCAIAPSFGDIFYNNSLKNGLLPVRLPAVDVEALQAQLLAEPGAQVSVDLPSQIVTFPDGSIHGFDIDPFAKESLLTGLDEIAYTLTQSDQIAAFEQRYGFENQ